MENGKIYDLVEKGFDRIEDRLSRIETRLSEVEKHIAKSEGKSSGLVTIKDGFIILCALGALVLSFVRLTQN